MHLSVWVGSGWWRTGKDLGGYLSVHLSVWVGSGWWRTSQYTCRCVWGLAGGGLRRRLPVSALVSVQRYKALKVTSCIWLIIKWLIIKWL